jgi:hypothetical protein
VNAAQHRRNTVVLNDYLSLAVCKAKRRQNGQVCNLAVAMDCCKHAALPWLTVALLLCTPDMIALQTASSKYWLRNAQPTFLRSLCVR